MSIQIRPPTGASLAAVYSVTLDPPKAGRLGDVLAELPEYAP